MRTITCSDRGVEAGGMEKTRSKRLCHGGGEEIKHAHTHINSHGWGYLFLQYNIRKLSKFDCRKNKSKNGLKKEWRFFFNNCRLEHRARDSQIFWIRLLRAATSNSLIKYGVGAFGANNRFVFPFRRQKLENCLSYEIGGQTSYFRVQYRCAHKQGILRRKTAALRKQHDTYIVFGRSQISFLMRFRAPVCMFTSSHEYLWTPLVQQSFLAACCCCCHVSG